MRTPGRRLRLTWPVACALAASLAGASSVAVDGRASIPARLDDAAYWRMVESMSEPNGTFRSENLVSNEDTFQVVIPRLIQDVKPGGAYLGVGPDQNFTYIVALRPKIAFIVDVRRGNLLEHLMYKALLELSADRADFLSRLFSRPRPEGLGADASADALFTAYTRVEPSLELSRATWQSVTDLLVTKHGFGLSIEDLNGMGYIFASFRAAGPMLAYASGTPSSISTLQNRYPTYRDLQTATDGQGHNLAYLGSEDAYRTLKAFEERNLLVPLVGNFAGPKAIRAVGTWLKEHDATATTFYLSNVEQYLFGDGIWRAFADNVAELPLDATSTFIRSCFNNCPSPYPSRAVMQLDSMTVLLQDYRAGRIRSYVDVLSHVK